MLSSWGRGREAALPGCRCFCARRDVLRKCISSIRRDLRCSTVCGMGYATRPRCRRGTSESIGAKSKRCVRCSLADAHDGSSCHVCALRCGGVQGVCVDRFVHQGIYIDMLSWKRFGAVKCWDCPLHCLEETRVIAHVGAIPTMLQDSARNVRLSDCHDAGSVERPPRERLCLLHLEISRTPQPRKTETPPV